MPTGWVLAALLVGQASGATAQQRLAGIREAILQAEDRRAPSGVELETLLRGVDSREAVVALAAIRAVGRLERPALAARLFSRLRDPRVAIRVETAHALGQAAQGIDSAAAGALAPIAETLHEHLAQETDPQVRGALARSLGRLPYRSAEPAERARQALLALLAGGAGPATRLDAARGLEALLRRSAPLLPASVETTERLRALASWHAGPPAVAARARRIAWTALARTEGAGPDLVAAALADGDEQVRRLAVAALAAPETFERRRELLAMAIRDASPMVRYEAVRAWGQHEQSADCAPVERAVRDDSDHVALLAIDLLAQECPGGDPVALLWPLVDTLAGTQRLKFSGLATWHRGARGMVTLAKIAPDRVRGVLARAAADYRPFVRVYAARAARALGDPTLLLTLANDRDHNVSEAAVPGLLESRGHGADGVFRALLVRPDYQLVMAAAGALAGTPARDSAAAAVLAALARITRERRETSRDARIALLDRLEEVGDTSHAAYLDRFLVDFDPAVARRAARVIGAWTGREPAIEPVPLPVRPLSVSEVDSYRGRRLRITMSPTAGAGVFEVELYPEVAPATVARVVQRASDGWYDDLTFHRVVPNFVIQGGSPGANEYAGDGPFMRDELSALSHERGTLGISTRGRDTGDAQLFVNLVDNPRLDFDYTVWGRVVTGMDVVDAILEGDVIARVELVQPGRTPAGD